MASFSMYEQGARQLYWDYYTDAKGNKYEYEGKTPRAVKAAKRNGEETNKKEWMGGFQAGSGVSVTS